MGIHESLFSRFGDCFSLQDNSDGLGPFIVPDSWTSEEPQPTSAEIAAWVAADALGQAKAAKTAEIADAAEAFLAPYRAEYRATEIATWDQQYAEAQVYTADPVASVPLLEAIATARGRTVASLAAAIISNRAAWVALSGAIVGQRLALQDMVDAAQTVEEVQAVSVSFGLPG